VLVYGAIEAPLAQPRAVFFGHFFSALIGVCIMKLFHLLPPERFEDLRWLCAALSTATAIVVMQITDTVHPPAGATALLPAVEADITNIGWYFLPVILLSSTLILAVGLVINNIQRRYPVFWISHTKPAPAAMKPTSADASTSARVLPDLSKRPVLASEGSTAANSFKSSAAGGSTEKSDPTQMA
jgi:CBS-domain-containing membrane protein